MDKSELEEKFVYMPSTLQESYELMQVQEKNAQGTILGGFIMKKAYELAYASAKLFSKTEDPQIDCIDIINFIKPVNIGHILKFQSLVIYT